MSYIEFESVNKKYTTGEITITAVDKAPVTLWEGYTLPCLSKMSDLFNIFCIMAFRETYTVLNFFSLSMMYSTGVTQQSFCSHMLLSF